ncbi:MAG: DNA helicase RecQ, partial [Myxococcales bacterium]|nr:DNA helicase RecQ [Myxococcales bacterium]
YRQDGLAQIKAVIARHAGDAGIVYAIKRRDVEELAAALQKAGVRALPYHAGLDAEVRRQNQEGFAREDVDVIVATVAFGMGIDRSNVRFVVHAGLPRSVEHYQQEAGRAGRDRLPSECVLIYSAQDLVTWGLILSDQEGPAAELAKEKLREVNRYARVLACRHRFLVEYFGEPYPASSCEACDVCLDEHAVLPDAVVIAQKIISCVARVGERFGAHHVADVLRGSKVEKLLSLGHDRLTTYGLLGEHSKGDVLDWIDQLVGLGLLERRGEFQTLGITLDGRAAMRGERLVKLSVPRRADKEDLVDKGAKADKGKRKGKREKRGRGAVNYDEGLFDALRAWRRELARADAIAPYLIFSDAALIEIAKARPATLASLHGCKGVGEVKLERYGDAVLAIVRSAPQQ